MDQSLIIDIIRRLQWPGDDAHVKWPYENSRRPTAYWLYKAICSDRNAQPMEKVSYKPLSKNSVFQHYQRVIGSMIPRFIIDPSLFNCSITSVLFMDDLYLSEVGVQKILKIDGIELVQRGLGLGPLGLHPTISVNILHKTNEQLENAVRNIVSVSPSISEFYRLKNYLFKPRNVDSTDTSNEGGFKIRSGTRRVLTGLVKYPLLPLNDLSIRVGVKRNAVYREYENISHSGFFKIEYSISNPIICNISLFQSGFLVEENKKDDILKHLKAIPLFRERLLSCRLSFDNVIYTLNWSKDYVDFLNYQTFIMKHLDPENVMLSVWQPRTYFNKKPIIEMINSQEN